MVFKYYPRYSSLIILIAFNLFLSLYAKLGAGNIIFYIISLFLAFITFGIRYDLVDGLITKYFFFLKIKEINIADICNIQVATVKEIGKIYFYIGKKAKETKETGYYLITKNNTRIKIDSGYQNSEGLTLGKYLITKCKVRHYNVEKYKWFNDDL